MDVYWYLLMDVKNEKGVDKTSSTTAYGCFDGSLVVQIEGLIGRFRALEV